MTPLSAFLAEIDAAPHPHGDPVTRQAAALHLTRMEAAFTALRTSEAWTAPLTDPIERERQATMQARAIEAMQDARHDWRLAVRQERQDARRVAEYADEDAP